MLQPLISLFDRLLNGAVITNLPGNTHHNVLQVIINVGTQHTHSVLTAIFPGEPGLAGCPLNSPSPFIPGLRILLGQA